MPTEPNEKIPVTEAVALIPVPRRLPGFPGACTRLFREIPLFVWSILYAQEEGIQPVVVTDGPRIAHTAEGLGARVYLRENVTCENYNLYPEIIRELNCQNVILLLPTSPLRREGVLRGMLQKLTRKQGNSYFTAIPLYGETQQQEKYKKIEAAEKVLLADGNIYGCTADYFLQHNNFIGDESTAMINEKPYSLRIASVADFTTLEEISLIMPRTLVHPIKKIVLVQNQRCVRRNYSEFIESCDFVIRSGKLDNIDTGKTGKRTDIMFASTPPLWHNFSEQEKHLPEVNAAALIFMFTNSGGSIPDSIHNWYPVDFSYTVYGYTLSATILKFVRRAFPDAHVYNFGAHGPLERTDVLSVGVTGHQNSDEHLFYEQLIKEGVLTDILEDDKSDEEAVYSTNPEWYVHTPDKIKIFYAIANGTTPYGYIYPWMRRLVIAEYCTNGAQSAAVLRWDKGKKLAVQWESSATIDVYTQDYIDVYKKVEVINRADYDAQERFLPIVPIHYTSVWIIGQDQTALHFLKKLDPDAVPGPFNQVWVPNLATAIDFICKRGEGWMTKADLDLCSGQKQKLNVYNKKTGHAIGGAFIEECDRRRVLNEQFTTVEGRIKRRWDSLLQALDDPLGRPLLVYVGMGKLWSSFSGRQRFVNIRPGEWFSLKTAYDSLCRLRQTFKSDVSLLYFDIPEKPEERVAEIIYSSNNFLAATYNIELKRNAEWRADEVWLQFGNRLNGIVSDLAKFTDFPEVNYEPIFCKWGDRREVFYVDDDRLKGYMFREETMIPIEVTSYIRGVELRIVTSTGENVLFRKQPNTIEYNYVPDEN